VGFAIYSASLLALFCLSTLHHGIEGPDWLERGLRIADYCAIFPLIAGSFTPICLVFLHGSGFGWGLLGTLWFLAACGIALTISAFDHLPRWVTLAMFGTMGWMGAVLAAAIYPDVGLGGVALIAAGGVAYSAGGVIYDMVRATLRSRCVTRFWRAAAAPGLICPRSQEWPNPACSEGVFGFHEIFHVFVLLGAGLHYAFMWLYVVPYNPRSER